MGENENNGTNELFMRYIVEKIFTVTGIASGQPRPKYQTIKTNCAKGSCLTCTKTDDKQMTNP